MITAVCIICILEAYRLHTPVLPHAGGFNV